MSSQVYVVDDDQAVRDALQLLLRSVKIESQEFASGQDFLAGLDGDARGCVLLDMRMPGMSGMDVQKEMNQRGSGLTVIFLTGHGDVPMAVQAMQEGAFDFVQKPFRDQDLLDTIRRALEQSEAHHEQREHVDEIKTRLALLTPRESEVLEKVVAGKSNKVIASDLGLSTRTVEIHRSRVMEKMQADSLAHLVRMYVAVEAEND
jgi:RNA polymerase sigma factor (sigma-70 family)